jgi:V8-like Glu-specific endopeptidase
MHPHAELLFRLQSDLDARRWHKAEYEAIGALKSSLERDPAGDIVCLGTILLGAFKLKRHFEGMRRLHRLLWARRVDLGLVPERDGASFRVDEARARLLVLIAQSLVDSGAATEALVVLLPLVQDGPGVPRPTAEALRTDRHGLGDATGEVLGLVGRAYKTLYTSAQANPWAPRVHDLEEALSWYELGRQYQGAGQGWHDINIAALSYAAIQAYPKGTTEYLRHRGRCDELLPKLAAYLESPPGAGGQGREGRCWTAATALEAQLGLWLLADKDRSSDAAAKARSRIDALLDLNPSRFVLGSLLRNIRDLWRPTHGTPAHVMVQATLERRALKAGEPLVMPLGQVRIEELETWMNLLPAIGRVEQEGVALGSGVLVAQDLVLTCDHVARVKGFGTTRDALQVHFPTRESRTATVSVKRVVRGVELRPESGDAVAGDIAALFLERHLDTRPLPLGQAGGPARAGKQPVHFAGYPGGAELVVAIQAGERIPIPSRLVYHSIDTRDGCSGGALLDEHHQLIGLHCQGEDDVMVDDTLQNRVRASEGVLVDQELIRRVRGSR